jgi:hypothetical protein
MVFRSDFGRAHGVLDEVVVDLNASVLKIGCESLPLSDGIHARFSGEGLRSDLRLEAGYCAFELF